MTKSGVTPSEAYLARLCGTTFLRMWSYPHLYKDQGKKGGGDGKELCDLLVVFGEHLLIFSDKDIELRDDTEIEVAWPRWYRKAVLESAEQVIGAERWLRQHPDRVFMDPKCTKRLPVELPQTPRVHRILTCRGAARACAKALGGSGSLMVTNRELDECKDTPFLVGAFDSSGNMFHIIDEAVLDIVLRTLDTVSDFVEYLTRKEAFFRKLEFVTAAGEEDLVAYYLFHMSPDEMTHDFVLPEEELTGIAIDQGQWALWLGSEQRKAKEKADRVSYAWDSLIETFTRHILGGTQYFENPDIPDKDRGLRWMARENRFRRRLLAESLYECLTKEGAPGQHFRRYHLPQFPGDPLWVFLVLPWDKGSWEYKAYREARRHLLTGLCFVVKYLHPEATDIVGIAMGPPRGPGKDTSEDVLYVDARGFGPTQLEAGRRLHEEAGFFKSPDRREQRSYEFPIDGTDRDERE